MKELCYMSLMRPKYYAISAQVQENIAIGMARLISTWCYDGHGKGKNSPGYYYEPPSGKDEWRGGRFTKAKACA